MSLGGKVRDRIRRLFGWGYPVPGRTWDAEYAGGNWNRLGELADLGHYSVVVGYCHCLRPSGSILDVGCGEGILQEKLRPYGYRRYVGIDLSSEAIRRASSRTDRDTVFVQADATTFDPDGTFEVILFSESLYYLDRPTAVMRRFEGALAEDGVFIVSMHMTRGKQEIWDRLAQSYAILDETRVTNSEGSQWICRVLVPPAAPRTRQRGPVWSRQ